MLILRQIYKTAPSLHPISCQSALARPLVTKHASNYLTSSLYHTPSVTRPANITMSSFFDRISRHFASRNHLGVTGEGGGSGTSIPENTEKATVAAGCFWGVEHIYRKHFKGKGLIDARVGYTGGDKKNPQYAQVCGGSTGHAEALQIVFDPTQVTYRTLIEFFYKIHDPTTLNRQGADAGTQYRSAIFYHSDEQKRIAEDVTAMANEHWWRGKIKTVIIQAADWYDAEKYHQRYLDHNPNGYECPTHHLRTFTRPAGYPAEEKKETETKKEEPVAPAVAPVAAAPDTEAT
ncbi:Peptide-methionine (S)-S-oxide reductase [Orbilia brochopaga]|uniref:peptide-methionine (S)-S-oxide reductase n=1 Tax=Orbilia brochopaga TaxID=3140254 RepID=A0AAV9UBN6_9PEZI